MLAIVETGYDNVVGMRISGWIDKSDMDTLLPEIKKALSRSDRIGVYVELESFEGITSGALMEEIAFVLPHFRKVRKKAIVTNDEEIADKIRAVQGVFEHIAVRSFPFGEENEAMKWAAS